VNLQKNGEGIVIGQVMMVCGLLTHNAAIGASGIFKVVIPEFNLKVTKIWNTPKFSQPTTERSKNRLAG
jgi:hypothetical protein